MADATIIATTLGAASITGVVGYLGIRSQGQAAERALKAEHQRLRLEHAEAHRQRKAEAYLAFLDAVLAFPMMAKDYQPVDEEGFERWYTRFQHTSHNVMLLGSPEAEAAVRSVDAVLLRVLTSFKADEAGDDLVARLYRALKPHDEGLRLAYEESESIFRADIARPVR